jgi:hypothetical protein
MEQTNKGEVFLQAFFDLLAKDYIEKAVRNLRKSVKEGNLRAMHWLGKLHYNGWLGCQRSRKRAYELWRQSEKYGPSYLMLRRDAYFSTKNLGKLEKKAGGDLAKAMYTKRNEDVNRCYDKYLEYYILASVDRSSPEDRVALLNAGAARGCTECLDALYRDMRATTWQRRSLWRHSPHTLMTTGPELFVEERLDWLSVDEFGCKENARHIVCLLMWARKTQNSPVLVTLPRDVLRLICERLLRTSWDETQEDARVWNHMPKKKRRKTTK